MIIKNNKFKMNDRTWEIEVANIVSNSHYIIHKIVKDYFEESVRCGEQ